MAKATATAKQSKQEASFSHQQAFENKNTKHTHKSSLLSSTVSKWLMKLYIDNQIAKKRTQHARASPISKHLRTKTQNTHTNVAC
jgi:hypothetical protein